ncbi:MAG: RnfABCDGE type electron transport complex subunit D, partial [Sedimentisphaerales bacterium]|nr:RnfABCDGE type electron transport complex subunit D [Sedimentisphaerales bacterium]
PLDVKRYMSMVIIGLVPAVLAAWYFFGLRVFALIMVSYAVGGTIEVLFGIIRKEEINEGFLVTGLLFPLVLPPTLPLWITAVGIAFGVIVGKELFGGTGRNLFNPALVGRCFLGLAYPREMSAEWLRPGSGITGNLFRYVSGADVDAVTGATPLGMAKSGEWASITDLFWGHSSGCVGETCSIALIIGGVFLLLTRVGNWRTVVSALGSFVILGTILHKVRPEAVGSVWFHLFAGGLLLGVFFMATDPVSSPNTNGGKWLYGSIIGIITVLIRNFTGYVEGMMFAILLGNIVAPILDEFAVKIRLRRLQHER